MAEEVEMDVDAVKEKISRILDGTFFTITKVDEGKAVAKCCNCVNKSISGTSNSTSNFLRHLKVCFMLYWFK